MIPGGAEAPFSIGPKKVTHSSAHQFLNEFAVGPGTRQAVSWFVPAVPELDGFVAWSASIVIERWTRSRGASPQGAAWSRHGAGVGGHLTRIGATRFVTLRCQNQVRLGNGLPSGVPRPASMVRCGVTRTIESRQGIAEESFALGRSELCEGVRATDVGELSAD